MHTHATVSIEGLRAGRVWTAVTAAFSHHELRHLGLNMLGLYFFGRDVGQLFGGKRVSARHEAMAPLLLPRGCWMLLPCRIVLAPLLLACRAANTLGLRCPPRLQLLLLYLAGGVAGSLAHCGWYYYKACQAGA